MSSTTRTTFFVVAFALLAGNLVGSLGFIPQAYAGLRSANIRMGSALKPKKIALSIGIERSLQSSYWPTLRYARRDAHRMAQAFRTQGQFDRIIQLDTHRQTTTRALHRVFKRLKRLVKSAEDTVVVYISAHGTVSRGRKRYIITSDTTRNVSQTGLAVSLLRKWLQQLPSRKLCLILATCYSGSPRSKSVKLPGSKGLQAANPLQGSRAIQILSAASFAQSAFESNLLQADVYTHFFLNCFRALKHKTIIKIHVCAATKTTPYVQKWNGEVQVPKAYSELGSNYDFALDNQSGTGKQAKGYFRGRKKGLLYRVFRIGRKGHSNKPRIAIGNEYLTLPPGPYRIQVVDAQGRVQRQEQLLIQPGKVSPLLSEWYIEWQMGTTFTSGLLKQGGDVAGSGLLGVRHTLFAVLLGCNASSVTFDDISYLQTSFDLRIEGGYRHSWEAWHLFGGAFATLALLLQDVNQRPRPSIVVTTGLTTQIGFSFHPRWTLALTLDGGVVPVQVNAQWRTYFSAGARLALAYRFE